MIPEICKREQDLNELCSYKWFTNTSAKLTDSLNNEYPTDINFDNDAIFKISMHN